MKSILKIAAYANTNAASKVFISPVPQNANLSVADYNLLTWVEIKGIGNLGETGKTTNIVNFPTWGDNVIQKAKGLTDAGSPTLEVARDPIDAGQTVLRNAAAVGNNNNYAFKIQRADGLLGGTGTIQYNRGLVGGPTRPNGTNEDFDLEVFTLAFQQEEVVVNPTVGGAAPVLTVAPAITGIARVGQTLSVDNGTFTGDPTIVFSYQWFAGGVAIVGATAKTYVLTADELGKVVNARVTAQNDSGIASGYSDVTAAVIA